MKPIQTTIRTGEIRDLIYQYFEARTSIYFMPTHTGDKFTVDGDIDINDLARWISAEVSPCPCDCTEGEFTGRWTSGEFSGEGPLVSAYTCAEHSPLVAAWCHLGTGLEPMFIPAPAGDWRAGLAADAAKEGTK
jgi:hypothetical protein